MPLLRSKRLRRICAGALFVAAVGVGQATVGATAAQARCADVGWLVNSTMTVNVGVQSYTATETPTAGTCDNNGVYQSAIASDAPGYRASVWLQNGGVWHVYFGQYGTGKYYFTYNHLPSYSYISLCLDDGYNWYCGWGSQAKHTWNSQDLTYYGINQGY